MPIPAFLAAAAQNPAVQAAAAKGLEKGMSLIGSRGESKQRDKASKRQAKEQKRKTLAELLNASFDREMQMGEQGRSGQRQIAGARAQAMQTLASQLIQALR